MIILASQSPRRRRLLDAVGVEFSVKPVDIDETRRDGEDPAEFVRRLALEKSQAAFARGDSETRYPILTADTIVVIDSEVLGKPADRDDARLMLSRLSGRTHVVYTGVCVMQPDGKSSVEVVETPVTFRKLSDREIESYLDREEPYDKAGSYAIQGTGGVLVDHLEGSYTNVVGLPMTVTLRLLADAGVTV